MNSYETILERIGKTPDPMMRRELINRIPEEYKDEDIVKNLELWWKARYYFVDKKQTRVGDRFVGIFLSASINGADKKMAKNLRAEYMTAIMSPETKSAKEIDETGFMKELVNAASMYMDSFKDPKPLLGLISIKDKSEGERQKRVAQIILEDHMDPFWRYLDDMDDIKNVASAICIAAEENYPGIMYVLQDIVDDSDVEGDFKLWILDVFVRANKNISGQTETD